jgi:hypothetical protein
VPTEIAIGHWGNVDIQVVAPRGEHFNSKSHLECSFRFERTRTRFVYTNIMQARLPRSW